MGVVKGNRAPRDDAYAGQREGKHTRKNFANLTVTFYSKFLQSRERYPTQRILKVFAKGLWQ